MTWLRSRIFDLFFVLWSLPFVPLMLWPMLRPDPALVRRLSRLWSHGVLLLLRAIVGIRHREIGAENKPAGPALYLCNHQSAFEALMFNTFVPDIAIVLRENLYRIPFFGWYLRHSPMIAIDRAGSASAMRQMMKEAKAAVAEGRSVLIFPEGTRRPPHDRAGFRGGAAAVYRVLDVPVVPVATNAGLFWIDKGRLKRPGTITTSYLPPVPPGGDTKAFLAEMERLIYAERDRLVREAEAGRLP